MSCFFLVINQIRNHLWLDAYLFQGISERWQSLQAKRMKSAFYPFGYKVNHQKFMADFMGWARPDEKISDTWEIWDVYRVWRERWDERSCDTQTWWRRWCVRFVVRMRRVFLRAGRWSHSCILGHRCWQERHQRWRECKHFNLSSTPQVFGRAGSWVFLCTQSPKNNSAYLHKNLNYRLKLVYINFSLEGVAWACVVKGSGNVV